MVWKFPFTHNDGWWNTDKERNDGNIGINISTVHISLHKNEQSWFVKRRLFLKSISSSFAWRTTKSFIKNHHGFLGVDTPVSKRYVGNHSTNEARPIERQLSQWCHWHSCNDQKSATVTLCIKSELPIEFNEKEKRHRTGKR